MSKHREHIGIREFNLRYRNALTASTLTVISAFAGFSAARSGIDDLVLAWLVSLLIMTTAFVAQILTIRKFEAIWLVGLSFGVIISWYCLQKLTGYPIASAAILLTWTSLSYILQVRSEHLDDEIEDLRNQLSSLGVQQDVLKSIEPLSEGLGNILKLQSSMQKSLEKLAERIEIASGKTND